MRTHRLFRYRIAGLPLLVLAAACGSERPDSAWTTAAEERAGGGRVVVNTPPEDGVAATVLEEELRIGTRSMGGPESFGRVRQVAPLPDGRVAVLDGMAEELRIFAADGSHERTFGGPGSGPGELEGAQGVLLDPDGYLRVPEQGNARLSLFHPDSGYAGSHRLYLYSYAGRGPWRAAIDSAGNTQVWSSGRYEDGFWLMVRSYDPAMVQTDSVPYEEYASDNNPDGETPEGVWRVTLPNGMRASLRVPFHPRPHTVIDPSGELWTTAERDGELRIARWAPPADTSLVIVSRRPAAPVTEADRDSAIAELESRFADLPSPPRLDYGDIPDRKPLAHGLSLGGGRVWVRLTPPGADTTAFDLFDRSGVHAGTVVLRAPVDPYIPPVALDDVVWAVVLDEADVQYVVRARVLERE